MVVLPVTVDAKGSTAGAAVHKKAVDRMRRANSALLSSFKNLVTSMEQFSRMRSAVRTITEVDNAMRRVRRSTSEATVQMKTMTVATQNLGRATRQSAKTHAQATSGMTAKNNLLTKSFVRLGGAMAALAAIKSTAKSIADFELTMRKVQGVTSQTDAQMRKVIATARELGATTKFSATEAGEGFLFLSRAGFKVQESIAALPSTLDLAAAGSIELGAAADLVSNVLSQFDMSARETTRAVDALVRVSNQANTDVPKLGEAMKFVGPVASALGKSVEEAAVLIGKLGDAGIQGSMAGRSLRGTFLALAAPTSTARKEIEALGLKIEDLDPALNSTQSIFKKFAKAGLGAGQAAKIFGRENTAAGLTLTKVADSINASVASLGEMNSASEIAKLNTDTLAGSFKNLLSAVEALKLSIGDSGLGSAFKIAVDFGTDLIRVLAGVDKEMKSNELLVKSVAFALKVMAVRWVALKALRLVSWAAAATQALFAMRGGMLAVNVAMAANPIGLLITGVAALVVVISDFMSKTAAAEKRLRSITDAAKDFRIATFQASETHLLYEQFDARIANEQAQLTALDALVERLNESLAKGDQSIDAEELNKMSGLGLPTQKAGRGGAGVDVVSLKQAVVSTEVLTSVIKDNIAAIKQQKKDAAAITKAIERKTAADNAAAEALRKSTADAVTAASQRKAAADVVAAAQRKEVDRMDQAAKAVGELRLRTDALRETQDGSLVTLARLNAQKQIHAILSANNSVLVGKEREAFFKAADAYKAAAISMAQAQETAEDSRGAAAAKALAVAAKQAETQRKTDADTYLNDLQMQADALTMTAAAVAELNARQDALNFADDIGLENSKAFVAAAVAKAKAINEVTERVEADRAASERWATLGTTAVNGLVDIFTSLGDSAKSSSEQIKNLARQISNLALKQAVLSAFNTESANGNMLQGGHVKKFAMGGMLVDRPMAIPQGVNILGEAGPEFVLPAARAANGKLGVQLSGIAGSTTSNKSSTHNDSRSVTIIHNYGDEGGRGRRRNDPFGRSPRQQADDAKRAIS